MLKYILISFLIITNSYAYTCEEMGYTQTIEDCPNHGLRCPAEPEKMFCCDPCGNTGIFMYTADNCSPDDGLQLAGMECGGGWSECRQCTSEYKYNKDNCRSPKILAGVQCGSAYTQCVYPVGSGCVPTVGYIYYADGSCHADYDDTKEPVGIIFDAANKLVVSLDDKFQAIWQETLVDIPDLPNKGSQATALQDMDGEANTDIIVAFAKSTGQAHPAAEHCANKTTANKKWFLPSLGQIKKVSDNYITINESLSLLPNTILLSNKWYWSSTEAGRGGAWRINMIDGQVYSNDKGSQGVRPIRCIFSF